MSFDSASFSWGEFFRAQRNAGIGLALDHIEQDISKFSGEKLPQEPPIEVWLDRLEKRCVVEKVSPEGVISFLVCGVALEVVESLNSAEMKDWSVVKDLLSRSFGLTDKEAFDRYWDRRLGDAEIVDLYVGELKRWATQLEISHDAKGFRLQVLSGLPRDVEVRLSEEADIFTKPLREFITEVRERIATFRAEGERRRSPSRELGAQGGIVCYRCQGKGHFAKDCPSKAAAPKGGCWICQGDHFARKCPHRKDKSRTARNKR